MDIDEILKYAVNKIRSEFNPYKIILFGSFAYVKPNAASDIDLMVVMDTAEETSQESDRFKKIAER